MFGHKEKYEIRNDFHFVKTLWGNLVLLPFSQLTICDNYTDGLSIRPKESRLDRCLWRFATERSTRLVLCVCMCGHEIRCILSLSKGWRALVMDALKLNRQLFDARHYLTAHSWRTSHTHTHTKDANTILEKASLNKTICTFVAKSPNRICQQNTCQTTFSFLSSGASDCKSI